MSLYRSIIRPIIFKLPAETVHEVGLKTLKFALTSKSIQNFAADRFETGEFGDLERFGLIFKNPVGLAAGFDKNGLVVNQLASLGFGFIEVGTVTYEPQPGNPKPRLFRLPDDEALINRLGFNNDGAFVVAERLKKLSRKCVVGVNIGRNKDIPNEKATENYLQSLEIVHPVADYIAVNISSPNTPNLRELQKTARFEELLLCLETRNRELGRKPLLVKIAPNLTESEVEMIVAVCMERSIAGIISTNTTIERSGLKTKDAARFGAGGLSGRPLAKRSTDVISIIYRYSKGKLPIIGVGGIFTAEDAFAKIAAGASLIQAYTGFIYHGPAFARYINSGLLGILKERGFATLDDAIGSGHIY